MFLCSNQVKATGNLMVLKPSFFNNTKSLSVIVLSLSISFFQVCSNHDMFIPLSRFCAFLKSAALESGGNGLVFACKGCDMCTI